MAHDKGAVLIVDDEPVIQRLLSSVLADAGYHVAIASDPVEAVRRVNEHEYDVALVDKNLGGENGLALIRDLKRVREELSCAIITGYASVESCLEALDVGAVGYLWKPFDDIRQVVGQVATFVDEHQRRLAVKKHFKDLGRQVGAARLSQPPRPAPASQAPVRPTSILVVAQDAGVRKGLEALLGSSGYAVDAADGVSSALRQFRTGQTDVVIAEDAVDSSSGVEFLARIRQLDRDVAFVLVAAAPSLSVLTRLIQLGGTGCLGKPLPEADEVIAKVRAAGARCRRQRGSQSDSSPPAPAPAPVPR